MSIAKIDRETFVHTLTVPWAEPLPVLTIQASDTAWGYAGEAMCRAGNHGTTALVRLATPAVTGFGLGKNWVDKHPSWTAAGAPVAAAGGALVGTAVGATGILCDVGRMAGCMLGAAAAVTCAGMQTWLRAEPKQD